MKTMVAKDKLSGQTLHKLAYSSETAQNVCLALGVRERVRGFSNINSLKYELRHQGFKIVEEDYMKMWKEWQDAGLGMIVLGRGRKQTKFVHFYDMRKIAQAALEGKDVEIESNKKRIEIDVAKDRSVTLDQIAKSIKERPQAREEAPKKPEPKQTVTTVLNRVFIELRPGVMIDIKLPNDVTSAEIDRIREVLNNLVPSSASIAA